MACAYTYEGVDYNDPLSNLLRAESNDEDDAVLDELESQYEAPRHVTSCYKAGDPDY